MEKDTFKKLLLEAYEEYCNAAKEEESRTGCGRRSETDPDSLIGFMRFIKNGFIF